MSKLHGLIAAPHTPFHEDGQLNLEPIEKQVGRLSSTGLIGAFVCGTTGEGLALTLDERRQVAARWVDAAQGSGLRIIVHVGAAAVADACELARHAQSIGADAVAALAPCYHRPASIEALVSTCQHIAGAAPDLPFYYYHIPSMTQVNLSMAQFIPAAREAIPSFAGLKYTHDDFMQLQECLAIARGELDILHGFDELLLAGMTFGLRAATGSTYNFAAPLYLDLMAAFQRQDLVTAAARQQTSVQLIRLLARFGFPAACKAMMELTGIPCGPVRMPLASLQPEQKKLLHEQVESAGLVNWLSRDV
ncbi:MAG: dihydrodipicolinate synthase family protein [Planctomycetales bacterium]|nr:dihydrodipicolinate synthase family protein [Planctomycetales bacterium]